MIKESSVYADLISQEFNVTSRKTQNGKYEKTFDLDEVFNPSDVGDAKRIQVAVRIQVMGEQEAFSERVTEEIPIAIERASISEIVLGAAIGSAVILLLCAH